MNRNPFESGAKMSKEKLPEIVKRRIQGFEKSYPDADFRTTSDQSEVSTQFYGRAGEIGNGVGRGDMKPVVVRTDRGIVVEKDQEIATEKMVGCTTLFISGPEVKSMVHLTPSNQLSYQDFELPNGEVLPMADETVKKVVDSLEEFGAQLSEYSLTILGNLGTDSGKFSYERMEKVWDGLKNRFEQVGLKNVEIVELPLDETLIYHSPEKEDSLFVMGARASYDRGNEYGVDSSEIDSYWIPIEKAESFDFDVKMRPDLTD